MSVILAWPRCYSITSLARDSLMPCKRMVCPRGQSLATAALRRCSYQQYVCSHEVVPVICWRVVHSARAVHTRPHRGDALPLQPPRAPLYAEPGCRVSGHPQESTCATFASPFARDEAHSSATGSSRTGDITPAAADSPSGQPPRHPLPSTLAASVPDYHPALPCPATETANSACQHAPVVPSVPPCRPSEYRQNTYLLAHTNTGIPREPGHRSERGYHRWTQAHTVTRSALPPADDQSGVRPPPVSPHKP